VCANVVVVWLLQVIDEAEQLRLDKRDKLVSSETQDSGVFITVSDAPKELHPEHILVVVQIVLVHVTLFSSKLFSTGRPILHFRLFVTGGTRPCFQSNRRFNRGSILRHGLRSRPVLNRVEKTYYVFIFLLIIPQKLSKITLSCPFSHRITTFTLAVSPMGYSKQILKPNFMFSGTTSSIIPSAQPSSLCLLAARDHTAVSHNPIPLETSAFQVQCMGSSSNAWLIRDAIVDISSPLICTLISGCKMVL
jgi:hypothetical protein